MTSKLLIDRYLRKLQPEMPEFIQIRTPDKGSNCLCLHRAGRELFLQKAYAYPPKTEEWQSSEELAADNTFPINTVKIIHNKLEELQPSMPEFIQMRRSDFGRFVLCLNQKGRKLFLDKAMVYPKKNAEWQSVAELAADDTFPMTSKTSIARKLKKFQPEMPEFIQMQKSDKGGPDCLCLHRAGRELFLQKAYAYPPKTEEWQSAVDLERDDTFPMQTHAIIKKKLEEMQPYMPDFIQKCDNNGQTPLCLHKDGREEFLRMVKQKSLQDGTKVVGAMSAVQDIENSTKPDDQHQI
jgi:hypothetical protein